MHSPDFTDFSAVREFLMLFWYQTNESYEHSPAPVITVELPCPTASSCSALFPLGPLNPFPNHCLPVVWFLMLISCTSLILYLVINKKTRYENYYSYLYLLFHAKSMQTGLAKLPGIWPSWLESSYPYWFNWGGFHFVTQKVKWSPLAFPTSTNKNE